MPSVAVHNGRYVKKNLTAQTISGAISWRLVRDLQSGVPARDRLHRLSDCGLLAVEVDGLRIVAGGRKKRSYNPPPRVKPSEELDRERSERRKF